jgi:hypothetical protein
MSEPTPSTDAELAELRETIERLSDEAIRNLQEIMRLARLAAR